MNPREKLLVNSIPNSNGCWIWLKAKTREGYGQTTDKSKNISAHRLSYLVFKGEFEPKLHIDHICHNRVCVNPEHLRTATRSENIRNRLPYKHKKWVSG